MFGDFHVHAIGHEDRPHTLENLRKFADTALANNIGWLGFADHCRYTGLLDFSLYDRLQEEYPQLKIRKGIEVDYFPDKMDEVREKVFAHDFDYVIGSVHYIGEWMFDHPDHRGRYEGKEPDRVYPEYLELVAASAETGLFQMVGHIDLLKIFGFRPTRPEREVFLPFLKRLKKSGVVVELNTNGWYKPVGEQYPSEAIVEMLAELKIPMTISSDAHAPEQVGRDFLRAWAILQKAGYKELAVFEKKKIKMIKPKIKKLMK